MPASRNSLGNSCITGWCCGVARRLGSDPRVARRRPTAAAVRAAGAVWPSRRRSIAAHAAAARSPGLTRQPPGPHGALRGGLFSVSHRCCTWQGVYRHTVSWHARVWFFIRVPWWCHGTLKNPSAHRGPRGATPFRCCYPDEAPTPSWHRCSTRMLSTFAAASHRVTSWADASMTRGSMATGKQGLMAGRGSAEGSGQVARRGDGGSGPRRSL